MRNPLPETTDTAEPPLPPHLAEVCDRFEDAWKAGARPAIEAYLGDRTGPERLQLLRGLLARELALRRLAGEAPAAHEYEGRFPEVRQMPDLFDGEDWKPAAESMARPTSVDAGAESRTLPSARPAIPPRYQVVATLGCGAFGVVYKAQDAVLQRPVAVKVSRRRADSPEGPILARLDHPGIVPVYDGGVTADGYCYLVSKFVEGHDLKTRLARGRLPLSEAVAIVAAVAEALHHAHQRRLVHRDIKPSNILLDAEGRAYVADFGLALREEDFGTGPAFAGTPPYMSPEQARGEGHRVDAASDIYSLGVVLYELLAGRRPFRGPVDSVLHQIKTCDPPPPSAVDAAVPSELDGICLRAVARRAADRYPTARELAEDLRHWLRGAAAGPAARPRGVACRGLRPFDAADADGFLDLLPGPRDRGGLPDAVRAWKARVESTDPAVAFPVGLLCGPCGCGKTSLVRAGLLPRLAGHVIAVCGEAGPADVEARLLDALRDRCPDLPPDAGLAASLAVLRRGGLSRGQKVLVVLDRFEQWLHAHPSPAEAELLAALRQCDGRRVQCLLVVRDDHLPAAGRFLRDLEVPLLEGQNMAAIEAFDPAHARKVLTAFGRAHGRLPEAPTPPGAEQAEFLDAAVAQLTQDGKVLPMRLALFFEVARDRPWVPATVAECGPADGLGVRLLEQAFRGDRRQEQAAAAVLQALLPPPGTDLRGPARPLAGLRGAAARWGRPDEVEEVLRVLDQDLRLITPTPTADGGQRAYQLTHDGLVPVVREWLARKRRETCRGRAELRLAERAAAWAAGQDPRHLPTPGEWCRIWLFTRRGDWSDAQRAMMRRATRRYVTRGCVATIVLVAVTLAASLAVRRHDQARAAALVEEAVTAPYDRLPELGRAVRPYGRWAYPRLRAASADRSRPAEQRLAACLTLPAELRPPMDAEQAAWFVDRLLAADADTFVALRAALAGPDDAYRRPLADRLYAVLNQEAADPRDPDAVDHLARRQAQAAVALLYLGSDAAWEKLRHRANPQARTPPRQSLPPLCGLDEPRHGADVNLRAHLLHELGRLRVDVGVVVDRLHRETNVSARRALILSLGEFAADQVAAAERERAATLLLRWYESDPDPGVHSAIAWLLGQGRSGPSPRQMNWGQGEALRQADRRLGARMAQKPYRILPDVYWSVTGDGEHTLAHVTQWQTFFRHGSPADEPGRHADEAARLLRFDQRYAIATKEVSVAQFERFLAAARPDLRAAFRRAAGDDGDAPAAGVPLFLAAEYCNWLSRQEGMAEKHLCFLVEGPTRVRLPRDHMRRRGYRLPTTAEWEYACRAGEVTSRFYGSSDALLRHFAWHGPTSGGRPWPVGQLKPNDLGLFDMYGNVAEWCLTPAFRPAGKGGWEEPTDVERVEEAQPWVVRGGSFADAPGRLRSAAWAGEPAGRASRTVGFRVARTLAGGRLPPGP